MTVSPKADTYTGVFKKFEVNGNTELDINPFRGGAIDRNLD